MKIKKPKGWKLNICVVTRSTGFCHYYRVRFPLEDLERRGLVNVVCIDTGHKKYMENPGKTISELIPWADVFIFQYSAPQDILVRFNDYCIQEKIPKLFVSDFDDDLTCLDPSNASYRFTGIEEVKINGKYMWKDNSLCDFLNDYKDKSEEEKEEFKFNIFKNKVKMLKMFRAMMYSDIITVTTPDLAATMHGWNNDVCILPNYINPNVMPEGKKEPRDYILIGWQGGDSHYHDLKMIMPALKQIKKKYKNKVKFRFMGAAFVEMYKEVEGEFIGWVDPKNFYNEFSKDLFDIGLIPLINPDINKFNRSKSNIKWLEYSYYGIPSVVSSFTPYKEHIVNHKTGILCETLDTWVEGLSKLIDDSLYRIKLGANAKEEVNNKFRIQTHSHKWYDLYMEALEQKVKFLSNR